MDTITRQNWKMAGKLCILCTIIVIVTALLGRKGYDTQRLESACLQRGGAWAVTGYEYDGQKNYICITPH